MLKRILRSRSVAVVASACLMMAAAWAQPKLRLVSAAIGPVNATTGANATPQTLEVFNAGTGALNLTLASSVPWMTATVGGSRACSARAGICLPINITFTSTALARGVYTGVLTLRDPNAIDAPQTATVTIAVGGGVPDRVDAFVPANGGAMEIPVVAGSQIQSRVSTTTGGDWLTLALDGAGSFRFRWDYRLVARHLAGMAEGVYNGAIAVSGSTFAPDNKTVPVVMTVTSRPIAAAQPVTFRIVQGTTAKVTQFAVLTNSGMGNLTGSSATVTAGTGGNWLAATTDNTALVKLEADPTGLALGSYTASLTVNSNAINSPTRIPVQLEVIAAGPPQVNIGGVLNNATFGRDEALAPGGITSLFGEQFTAPGAALSLAPGAPLPTTLGGARVLVNDQPVPLYFVSYGQINFQIPFELPPGEVTVRVERAGTRGNGASVTIGNRSPRVLIWPIAGNYGIVVNNDGTLPLPTGTTLGAFTGRPARAGDALVIYAIGLGQTTPPVLTGVGSPGVEPLARVEGVTVAFGARGPFGTGVTPIFAGLSPGFVGLYQINVIVPDGLQPGNMDMVVDVDGTVSNTFRIVVQ